MFYTYLILLFKVRGQRTEDRTHYISFKKTVKLGPKPQGASSPHNPRNIWRRYSDLGEFPVPAYGNWLQLQKKNNSGLFFFHFTFLSLTTRPLLIHYNNVNREDQQSNSKKGIIDQCDELIVDLVLLFYSA